MQVVVFKVYEQIKIKMKYLKYQLRAVKHIKLDTTVDVRYFHAKNFKSFAHATASEFYLGYCLIT